VDGAHRRALGGRGACPRRGAGWACGWWLPLDYTAPLHGLSVPGLGRSRTEEWTIEGGHLAERCQLVVIVVLGESILLTGATFADLDPSAGTVTAFVVAFAGIVALWWIYFDRGARLASDVIAAADDVGRLGRSWPDPLRLVHQL